MIAKHSAHKGLMFLIIGSQIVLWGSVIISGYIYDPIKITTHQKYIIEENGLQSCVSSQEEQTTYNALNNLNRTWTGNAIAENLRDKNTLICSLPDQEKDHWTTTKSAFFEQNNILALSRDDIVNLVHESIHSMQETPKENNLGLRKTAAYQTLIAREVSALCLSVLDGYQRSLDVNTKRWRHDEKRTYSEYGVVKILENIANEDRRRDTWIRKPAKRLPARIVDELIYRTLNESFVFADYETPFYAADREHFIWGNDLDFTPLTDDELIRAMTGILYTKEDLPKTIELLNDLGKEASSAQWYISRMEQDYLMRKNAIRERIEEVDEKKE